MERGQYLNTRPHQSRLTRLDLAGSCTQNERSRQPGRPYRRAVAIVVHIFENETLVAFTPKMIVAAMPAVINTY